MSTEEAVFQSQVLDKRIDLTFEQDEKLIIIELNPQMVQQELKAQFQQLNTIIIRYLDYALQNCLEIQYKKHQLIITSQQATVKLTDKRIVMFTNDKDQLVDTQGIWIYLNKNTLDLMIGYGEARIETQVSIYKMESVQKNIKAITSVVIWQESIPINILPSLMYNHKGSLRPVRIHTKDHFIPSLSESILQNCQNIFQLNQGKQAKQLAAEIEDLYQSASQVELQKIEQSESSQYPQKGARFSLGELIHHSVTIPGCKLNQILQKKKATAQQNGLDPYMSYIRLGLGHFNKDSAGHQFVLEIWPFKHYSSIHDHAGQYGLVKVLQGVIDISIYAILSNAKHLMNPIKTLTCNQNDMTWLSPKLNQVHQLKNFYPQTTITLQCYKYSQKSQNKVKNFAYVANEQYKKFNPVSDFPDIELHQIFKELVAEYSNLHTLK
ncbi:unnamed protein product (macronuclear) [Paramecium tetraurelia]|uniref:Cysteine dioxygenase n=1 Tax=Paramecium tetraurelia TaxID=5888 RepID=A0BN34_PARTE|nr:uncharacterized protein GSPATT00030589001 [Paramecium tetraurelia]CAK59951.1 unnamed protein product [Paramecium tetraurelia]|eukprot:XP_001427349.1 hypothetical protein (macronuclear) [Paramecium tetraurelia strain d4-2]